MNIFKKAIEEVKELDAALTEYKTPKVIKPTPTPNPNPNYKPPAFVASPKQSKDKTMYGLKLYVTFEDINDYIRAKVDPKYKNCTFIPINAEVNTTDLSIEISLVEATSLECRDECRFKLELPKE